MEDRADRAATQHSLTSMQGSFDARMSEMTATFNERLREIDKRMWAILIATCGAAIIGVAVFVFYELTRPK